MWFKKRNVTVNKFVLLICICYVFLVSYILRETSVNSTIRNHSTYNANKHEHKFVSLCSSKADNHGLHQKVIAFSLYGNFSNEKIFYRYVNPIKSILNNITETFPGNFKKVYFSFFISSLFI